MPGAERLAMDPELLRLREGPQLNRGLLGFNTCLRELAEAGAVGGVPLAGAANVESSVLTRLLAGAWSQARRWFDCRPAAPGTQ